MANPSDNFYIPREYWATRNYKTSARLYLQHHLFQNTFEFLLHPTIATSWNATDGTKKTIRIADLGCGNAQWLRDLSKQATSELSLQLHGYDINPKLFPVAAHLPENVKLETWDVFADELPEGCENSFDLVHLRAFASIVPNNDPGKILKNVMRLLKPGGWLQWEDTSPEYLVSVSPSQDVSKTSCDTVINILAQGAKIQNMSYEWISKLDAHFRNGHFEDSQLMKFDKKAEDFDAWTKDFLLVWDDLTLLFPSENVVPKAPLTREMWEDLFLKAVEETDRGVSIHQSNIMLAIGRKPAP